MIRRAFIASIAVLFAPLTAFAKRRRKPKLTRRSKRAPPDSRLPNATEKRQLIEGFPTDRIRVALDVRFLLGFWTVEELQKELEKRESPS